MWVGIIPGLWGFVYLAVYFGFVVGFGGYSDKLVEFGVVEFGVVEFG